MLPPGSLYEYQEKEVAGGGVWMSMKRSELGVQGAGRDLRAGSLARVVDPCRDCAE